LKERYVSLALLMLLACANEAPEVGMPGEEAPPEPIILIELTDLPTSSLVPWNLREQSRIPVAAGVLCMNLDETDIPEVTPDFVELMASSGRLMLLYGAGQVPESSGRNHIVLRTDSTGRVRALHPPSLESEIRSSDWASWRGTQEALVRLFLKYQPDAVAIRLGGLREEDVRILADHWLDIIERSGGSLVLYSPPRLPDYRGWVAFASRSVRSDTVLGLGAGGVQATIRVLAGLRVDPGRIESLPAVDVLEEGGSW
jgi:hypothetical protein